MNFYFLSLFSLTTELELKVTETTEHNYYKELDLKISITFLSFCHFWQTLKLTTVLTRKVRTVNVLLPHKEHMEFWGLCTIFKFIIIFINVWSNPRWYRIQIRTICALYRHHRCHHLPNANFEDNYKQDYSNHYQYYASYYPNYPFKKGRSPKTSLI